MKISDAHLRVYPALDRQGVRSALRLAIVVISIALSGSFFSTHAAISQTDNLTHRTVNPTAPDRPNLEILGTEHQAPTGSIQHQHCAACPCVHAYVIGSGVVTLQCEIAAVAYPTRLDSNATKFAPPPLRKPPRI